MRSSWRREGFLLVDELRLLKPIKFTRKSNFHVLLSMLTSMSYFKFYELISNKFISSAVLSECGMKKSIPSSSDNKIYYVPLDTQQSWENSLFRHRFSYTYRFVIILGRKSWVIKERRRGEKTTRTVLRYPLR